MRSILLQLYFNQHRNLVRKPVLLHLYLFLLLRRYVQNVYYGCKTHYQVCCIWQIITCNLGIC